MPDFTDTHLVLQMVQRLISVGVCISSLEFLVGRKFITDESLLSWTVARLRSRVFASRAFEYTIGRLLTYPAVLALITIRLVCAASLLLGVAGGDSLQAWLTVIIAIVSVLLFMKSPFGQDGADQMVVIIYVSLALAHGFGSQFVRQAALWFIALQACLSYFTAGVAKLFSPVWRRENVLPGIFGTVIYGQEWAVSFLSKRPRLAKTSSWMVIAFECLFPLTLLRIKAVTSLLLLAGLGFHLGSAIFMRLNTFFWSFIATYPAIVYCSKLLA